MEEQPLYRVDLYRRVGSEDLLVRKGMRKGLTFVKAERIWANINKHLGHKFLDEWSILPNDQEIFAMIDDDYFD